ncbi:hypothetical protein ACTXT7_012302 [Hymenolepis weldensis]
MGLRFTFAFLLIIAFVGICVALPTVAKPDEAVTTVSPKTTSKATRKTTREQTVITLEAEEEYEEDDGCGCGCGYEDPGCDCQCLGFQMEPIVPTIAEVIVQTLPTIPYDLAFTLNFMQPELVDFIIGRHANLDYLLLHTDTPTLEYIVSSTPEFARYLSRLPPESIYDVLFKMPYPCQYLLTIDKIYADAITFKLPMAGTCFPPTTTSTTTTTTTTAAPTTTAEPNMVPEDHFSKEELDTMTAKVPNIRSLLMKANPKKLREVRELVPDFTIIFNELDDDIINVLNSFDLSKLSRKLIWNTLHNFSENRIEVELFSSLFE